MEHLPERRKLLRAKTETKRGNLIQVVQLMAVLPALLACMTAAPQAYRYVRWSGLDRLVIEKPIAGALHGQIVVSSDAFLRTYFCDSESEFHCFFSPHYAFAVPKAIDSETHDWVVRGVRFELLQRDVAISVFGHRVDGLYVIRSPADSTTAGGPAWRYLYSPRDGLIAFGTEDLGVTYWLEGTVGFGCSSAGGEPQNATSESAARDEFEAQYQAWLELRSKPADATSSGTSSDQLESDAYRAIVAGGRRFLPFIVEKLEEGDFLLNDAMARITGVNIRVQYPEEKIVGAQGVSELWLRWWSEYQGKDPRVRH